jgi:protein-S-isoprenylcysteine O-methyltransferase Ste14
MDDLARRAFTGLARFQIALAVMLFLPAWSLTYWQGWLYWCLFGASLVIITLYFLRHEPSLVERRMRAGPAAEKEPRQKLIQTFAVILMAAIFILSALDHARGWSSVWTATVLIADAFVLLGFFVMFLAFRDNAFAAAIIQVDVEQSVIDTGPLRARAPSDVCRRDHPVPRHPAGARLVVGPDPGRAAHRHDRVAAARRGIVSRAQPARL